LISESEHRASNNDQDTEHCRKNSQPLASFAALALALANA
jgi:hypothetical protein